MKKYSLILGFFDGVHAGHREVIKTALNKDTKSILLTFNTSPAAYFGKKVEYIFSREKNYQLIKSLGVDEIIEQDFSELANISANDYLKKYLINKFAPVSISTGFNYTFGAERLGTPELLSQNQNIYNYKYFCSQAYLINNEIVSSTKIRNLLCNGNIEKANSFLASKFSINSIVIEGKKLGRKLGFPTANMLYPQNIVKIPYGVYAARVLGKPAVLNWGIKPTTDNKNEILEVHIPNFEGNLYNQALEVEFIKKLRDEQKFNNLDELKHQIKKDTEECLKL